MATIKTPVEGFTGVVVGVNFTKGTGESADPSVLQYFERHGYGVEYDPESEPLTQPAKSAPKTDWAAYATQEGHDVEGLNADEIKALFLTPETGTEDDKDKTE